MHKIVSEKFKVNFVSLFICSLLFFWLLFLYRYVTIINDDMFCIVARDNIFFHGRFLTEFIGNLFIKKIPQFLNINIQDFAIISLGVVNSLIFISIPYLLSELFYVFHKKNQCFNILITLSFFVVYSLLIQIGSVWEFDTYLFFIGYIGIISCFLLFYKKIFELYINSLKLNKKDILLLSLYSVLVSSSNEFFAIAAVILLVLMFLEKLFIIIKYKKQQNIGFIILPLFLISIISLVSFIWKGSLVLWDVYSLKINWGYFITEFFKYSELFFRYAILRNFYFIIPLLLGIFYLLKFDKTEISGKILRYIIYSNIGFFAFLFGLILLPKTCIYTMEENKYWFLHPGLLADYSVFLYASLLLLFGYIINSQPKKLIKVIMVCVLLCSSGVLIFNHFTFEKMMFWHSHFSPKKLMYINDKISLFYLKRNKTVVLPKEQFVYIIPYIAPADLNEKPELFGKTYTKEETLYLVYLEQNYKVKANSGITFKTYDEALKEYEEAGGTFSEEELKELKFSNIN